MRPIWRIRALFALVVAVWPARLTWASAAQSAAPDSPGEGLQLVGDERLLNELADRGLDSLLDRYFELRHTPQAERQAIRSTEALRELNNPKLSYAEKERRVREVAAGINSVLPALKDPNRLSQAAGLLLENGVLPNATLLERWGESAATQARLRPIAEAVYQMLDKASKEAAKQAEALSSRITPQNQNTVGAQWEKLNALAQNSEYGKNMMVYYLALSLPPGERAKIVEPAIAYLKQFDTTDSAVQPYVRVMLGKLNLVEGKYDDAIKLLDSVATLDKQIQPPPQPAQQYDARSFGTLARLEAGLVSDARQQLQSLITWQKQTFTDAKLQEPLAANAALLEYRIDVFEADHAKDPAAKATADKAANDVLLKLLNQTPENQRGIIYQQLVERLPKDAPVSGLDPLLLQGLLSKARGEAYRPQGAAPDEQGKQTMERGLEAAAEILRRKDAPGITQQMRDEAAKLTPIILEALGRKVEAANGYLQYAVANAVPHPQTAEAALQDAGRLTFELRKTSPDDPKVVDLFDRFLPVAINPPFNKTSLAFYYGQRLRLKNQPQEALKYFRAVPKSDRNFASAQYDAMQCLQDLLENPTLPDSQRIVLSADLERQAEQVKQQYANSQDPAGRERAAIATLTEAKTHLRMAVGKIPVVAQKEAQDSLKALEGFDEKVKQTVSNAQDQKVLIGDALLTRVNAYITLGKLEQASGMLVALLNQTGGAQGAEYVRGLLERLDKSLDQAEANHDANAMRDIARSEAQLSGYLVEWAKNNSNQQIRNYTYQYMVFDARTKRLAGALATDPAERTKLLQEAMNAYLQLQQPQYVKMYQATINPQKVRDGSIDPNQPDPNVQLGIGLTDFELRDWKDASELLGTLLNSGKLGGPTLPVRDSAGNDEKIVDNDVYWDATYKLYRSNVELAKGIDDPMLDGTKRGLKNLLIRGGIPAKWQEKFDGLRKQIIPQFNVADLTTATSQPVTSR